MRIIDNVIRNSSSDEKLDVIILLNKLFALHKKSYSNLEKLDDKDSARKLPDYSAFCKADQSSINIEHTSLHKDGDRNNTYMQIENMLNNNTNYIPNNIIANICFYNYRFLFNSKTRQEFLAKIHENIKSLFQSDKNKAKFDEPIEHLIRVSERLIPEIRPITISCGDWVPVSDERLDKEVSKAISECQEKFKGLSGKNLLLFSIADWATIFSENVEQAIQRVLDKQDKGLVDEIYILRLGKVIRVLSD